MISPGSPAQTADLARALATSIGEGIAILDRHHFPYRSTFPLEELMVRMGDGTERSLVFKDLSRKEPTDPVWQVKAPFLHDPRREIEVYRDVLAPAGLTAPECVAVATEPDLGRYWLFLEKVEGELLWQIGDLDVWRAAARWLGDMHARFADRTEGLPPRLLVHDRDYHRRWIERARRFARSPEASNGGGRVFDRLAERCRQVVDWLIEQPTTFLHGEFYPSNVVIESTDDGIRVRPVDWEMAAVGPGLLDLAALASGAWGEREREALATSYREAWPSDLRPALDTLPEGLDRCRLLLAVQWLGWSPDWSPPREHAHDWMATAIELAEAIEP